LLLRSRDADPVGECEPLGCKNKKGRLQNGSAIHLILPQKFRSSFIAAYYCAF